jgi:hypothetical protein
MQHNLKNHEGSGVEIVGEANHLQAGDSGRIDIPRISEKCSSVTGGFGVTNMSRFSFALLIVTGLLLTAYFGAAAWRVSDDSQMDLTGHIAPGGRR